VGCYGERELVTEPPAGVQGAEQIPLPLTLSFQTLNLPFLQILPTVVFVFSSGLTNGFPSLFTVTSEHIRFLLFIFLYVFFKLFSCRFLDVD